LAPQVLGAIVRRYGNFDLAEDATQEALITAAERWPVEGVPASPKGWLVTVASRRLTDALRSRQARQRREDTLHRWSLPQSTPPGTEEPTNAVDDSLVLLFLACHPSLSPASQIALTLRSVGGLATAEIARAFMVPEATMTRRITRAKQTIKESGEPFRMPAAGELRERLDAVLHTLYLIFNEGYAATAGPGPHRVELTSEAIRLSRMVRRQLPGDSESAGLLALMLLTDARRPARMTVDGAIVPMAEQDRSLWDRDAIDEGTSLLEETLRAGEIGPYQIQAAIAALHDEAPTAEDTDWPQILELYELLLDAQPSPVVALNHAVALAMVEGPQAGLERLRSLEADDRIARGHRLHSVRAHLLELAGDAVAARESYLAAAASATNLAQRRYLGQRAARLSAAN
jgi:RNA polymerase sigma factor (sigma-70 family)